MTNHFEECSDLFFYIRVESSFVGFDTCCDRGVWKALAQISNDVDFEYGTQYATRTGGPFLS